jgi:hypothetical protein
MSCGDAFEMRCIVAGRYGKTFDCTLFPRRAKGEEMRACATAEIDIMKGVIKFYG